MHSGIYRYIPGCTKPLFGVIGSGVLRKKTLSAWIATGILLLSAKRKGKNQVAKRLIKGTARRGEAKDHESCKSSDRKFRMFFTNKKCLWTKIASKNFTKISREAVVLQKDSKSNNLHYNTAV